MFKTTSGEVVSDIVLLTELPSCPGDVPKKTAELLGLSVVQRISAEFCVGVIWILLIAGALLFVA